LEGNSVAADPLIGRELGKCLIESRIGAGGMGVVYLAQHRVIEDRRAVKVLSQALAGQEGYRARFLKEARLPAGLNHPSILPIYDAGDEDGVLYLVMPYVRGADLQVLLDDGGPLDIDEVVSILGPVADALDQAHASGVIHRDVKPSNVLVGELESKGRRVYLSDFGLVKALDDVTRASGTTQGMVVGTPPYIAPELWREEPLDGRLDQYALACTLFQALTGAPPFQANTMYAWMYAHTSGPIPSASRLRPELPKDVDGPLARGLAKDSGARFDSCTALIDAVGSSVGALPAAPDDTLEIRLREETRIGIETVARQRSGGSVKTTTDDDGRRWWRYVLAAAVVLVAGLALLLWPGSDDGPDDGSGGGTVEPDGLLPAPPIVAARGEGDDSALVAVDREGGGAIILRIQKDTLRQSRVAIVDDRPEQIVADGDTTWILTSSSGGVGTLFRLPGDDSEPDPVNVGGAPGEMTQTETTDEVWVTVPTRDEILVVDKEDLERDVINDVKGPSLITPAGDVVVVVGQEGWSSIDAATHEVDGPNAIEGVPTDIATAGGDVWITTQEGPVLRIDAEGGEVGDPEEALDVGGEPLRVVPRSTPPVAVWFPLKEEGRLVVARNLSLTLEEQDVPLPAPAIRISTAGDPVVLVTAAGEVLRITAETGEPVGEPEHVQGTMGPMVPLGNDVLLLASDRSMYLLSRQP
jgi:tRNA A-37 threonylcarbamoyl transferase component Bud32